MKHFLKISLTLLFPICISCNTITDTKDKTKHDSIGESNRESDPLPDTEKEFPEVKSLQQFKGTQFVPTLESSFSGDKNAIYCATMLFAWDAVREIVSSPIEVENVSNELKMLNNSRSYLKVLDTSDYKIKAEVVDFNVRTEASFKKSLPFDHVLSTFIPENDVVFNKTSVESFGVSGNDYEASLALNILYYKDDNNFIISLSFRDTLHEIILSKSENHFNSMDKIISEINSKIELGQMERKIEKKQWRYKFKHIDEVVIPKFKFNIESNYKDLEGQTFKSKNSDYTIKEALQQVAFVLDEGGAGVGSDATIFGVAAAAMPDPEKPRPKHMRFDKPFFLMMKKTNNTYPYFAMWTSNTTLMVIENPVATK